jgi:hypothetical protein
MGPPLPARPAAANEAPRQILGEPNCSEALKQIQRENGGSAPS